jgi:hypothetical protein
MSQTKPSSLGPAKPWPNSRLRRAFPVDGHNAFKPSGDYDGDAPSMTDVVRGAISEERAAALQKSKEAPIEYYYGTLFLDMAPKHRLWLMHRGTRFVWLKEDFIGRVKHISIVYGSREHAMFAVENNRICWHKSVDASQ